MCHSVWKSAIQLNWIAWFVVYKVVFVLLGLFVSRGLSHSKMLAVLSAVGEILISSNNEKEWPRRGHGLLTYRDGDQWHSLLGPVPYHQLPSPYHHQLSKNTKNHANQTKRLKEINTHIL